MAPSDPPADPPASPSSPEPEPPRELTSEEKAEELRAFNTREQDAAWRSVAYLISGPLVYGGIGYLLVKGQASISTSIVMSGMIAIGIVGFAIDALLQRLEARIHRRRGRG